MGIKEYFPELEAKGYVEVYNFSIANGAPKVIPPGSSNVQVLPSTILHRRGLAVSFLIGVDNPQLEVTFNIDNRSITGNFNDLKVQSLRGIPKIPFIVAYNPTFRLYEAVLEAEFPFNNNVFVSVNNPTTTPINIVIVDAQLYLYKKGFYSALAKLKSGNMNAIVNDYSLSVLEDVTVNNNRNTTVL